eukprot:CAMPEP_0116098202 /NCGR_PEP_ID=MMETSP0327-20121206/11100_1 /TAXON_ID=44447 /ORGANISM="Pseudo-nitzschia delicatissima, Strain B596" /LENGTH=58 /DNA_ID=CAMNT_0003589979 /DNA_START=641 /DNA_END=817 /DNA_ORIENTATION=-
MIKAAIVSGYFAAKDMAILPPIEWPTKTKGLLRVPCVLNIGCEVTNEYKSSTNASGEN